MSNPSSPTLDEVVENIVKEFLRERAEQENREIALEEVREETKIEIEAGDAKAFYHARRRERLDWDSLPAFSDIGGPSLITVSKYRIQKKKKNKIKLPP